MKIIKYIQAGLTALALSFSTGTLVYAENADFPVMEGTIHAVDRVKSTLTVDDLTFEMDSQVTVLGRNGTDVGLLSLTPGTRIEFHFVPLRQQHIPGRIVKIQLLR